MIELRWKIEIPSPSKHAIKINTGQDGRPVYAVLQYREWELEPDDHYSPTDWKDVEISDD